MGAWMEKHGKHTQAPGWWAGGWLGDWLGRGVVEVVCRASLPQSFEYFLWTNWRFSRQKIKCLLDLALNFVAQV